jgi:ribose 5-phosphate isomerase A
MDLKNKAASRALELVQDETILGLGSGSTATCFIDLLAEKLARGQLKDIQGVATSRASAERAHQQGIPLISLAEAIRQRGDIPLDLAVDGADEVNPRLDLIKGLGRALLREKIIAVHAQRFIILVDDSKLVERLGSRGPLPVEILPFEAEAHVHWLNTLGCRAGLWREADGSPATTDNGNQLALCSFPGGIPQPYELAWRLAERPGVIEHGLFLGMAGGCIVAGDEGVRLLEPVRTP